MKTIVRDIKPHNQHQLIKLTKETNKKTVHQNKLINSDASPLNPKIITNLKIVTSVYIPYSLTSLMNTKNKTIAVLTVALSLITATVAINISSTAFAQNGFNAKLTGQEEVPPVQTQATGSAVFHPMGDSVHFIINASDIQDVTAGHIHSGSQGENGPVVATLFQFDSPQNDVNTDGMISADDLEGPMQGKQISDLATAMNNVSTYVNVHTEQNPNGEIRGQIMGGQ